MCPPLNSFIRCQNLSHRNSGRNSWACSWPVLHRDPLEMPNGRQVLLTQLEEGQNATVPQLPAAPKTEKETEDQKRAEYVG
jgi:hypothetical protein